VSAVPTIFGQRSGALRRLLQQFGRHGVGTGRKLDAGYAPVSLSAVDQTIVYLVVTGTALTSSIPLSRRLGKRRTKFFAQTEYWVYLPGNSLPDQTALMDRVIGKNPYRNSIGTKEGLLLSDVRLHIALVLRNKNPHVFRPDLHHAHSTLSREVVRLIDSANSLVKIRYASDEVLRDKRHLQFMPHLADAVADLGQGHLIYDVTCEKFHLRSEWVEYLQTHPDVTGPDLHTAVEWKAELESGYAYTVGLAKVGHKELRTPSSPSDHRVILTGVLNEAIQFLWHEPTQPQSLEVQAFDGKFRVMFEKTRSEYTRVRVQRLNEIP
jgi:hypothetical protein